MNEKVAHKRDSAHWYWLLLAWITALAATLGALFIGEIMGQTPCNLCWYQRIAMFPLALILGIACLRSDVEISRYALPLAVTGAVIALYHSLSYAGVITKSIVPCGATSCSGSGMTIFGVVPLPYLSALCFGALCLFLALSYKRPSHV
ncbi:MAG: disulfide bond formation protein B [Pseudomonadales bacterium]